ncbi:MAG: LysM peptidoglycan-binding domain-containing protein [Azonexus sp.]
MVRIISALILAVTAVCASAAEPLKLVDNPPDRHVVVRGDTLWGISGKFLKEPWRWPEIWNMNREEIKNPHLIYPGQVVYLDRSGKTPRLRLGKPVKSGSGTVKLEPHIYSNPSQQAIPSIPPNQIEPFLSQPLVVEQGELDSVPRIVAGPEYRGMMGNGDQAFATGIFDASVVRWNVFRPGKPLTDPDTGNVIGYEAFFLGNANLVQAGEPAALQITVAKEEIMRGDRLIPAPPVNIISYVPHRPDNQIAARVMTIYGGVNEGGRASIVSLNRGKNDGLEVGHVLALFRNRIASAIDEDTMRRVDTPIPEERYALVFVFRVFNGVSYALVLESSKPITVGDYARNP